MSRAPVLCIAGGGTGGHVMPALALADAARKRWPELTLQFIGAERGLEARLLPERGEQVLLLRMHGIKGAGILQKLKVLAWELPRAVLSIRRTWKAARPDLLVGVGGYASVSGVLAALTARIPVVLYEQNAMPGMVNRKLSRFCRQVMLGFSAAATRFPANTRVIVTGNSVRATIANIRWQMHRPPHLLIMGGSQGARILNENAPAACALLARKGRQFHVTHIAGSDPAANKTVANAYAEAAIQAQVLPFCDDMASFYAKGDLLIARSGAMSVSEAAMCGMPAIFIPLPHAADQHQHHNALAQQQGARILEQRQLTAITLAEQIETLLFDPEKLAYMSKAARQQAPTHATDKQLDVLANYLYPNGEAI